MKKVNLTQEELGEIRVMHDMVKKEIWKYALVESNTAMVLNGKDWLKTQEGIINLMNNERENYISKCCRDKGITGSVSIDLETGEIFIKKEKKDE